MINFNFALKNPFSKSWKILSTRYGKLTENKSWELNTYKTNYIVSISFDFTIRQSHSGLNVDLGLLGYMIEFSICDNRHWNPGANAWEI